MFFPSTGCYQSVCFTKQFPWSEYDCHVMPLICHYCKAWLSIMSVPLVTAVVPCTSLVRDITVFITNHWYLHCLLLPPRISADGDQGILLLTPCAARSRTSRTSLLDVRLSWIPHFSIVLSTIVSCVPPSSHTRIMVLWLHIGGILLPSQRRADAGKNRPIPWHGLSPLMVLASEMQLMHG